MPWPTKVCAVAVALLWVPPVAAPKPDTVMLRNGDLVTGEIKRVDRGTLTYKTDDMGTLAIEWDNVLRLTSRRNFEVEVASGRRYYGILRPADVPEFIVVAATGISDTLPRVIVVRLEPLGASVWSRVDGHIDVGFTLQRANNLRQLSAAAEADYRTRAWRLVIDGSVYFQDQADVDALSRNSVTLSGQRFYSSRWSGLATFSLEQNEELDLDLRALFGGGVGRYLKQSNRQTLLVAGGLTYTRERFVGAERSDNLEGLINARFDFFRLDPPKSDVRVSLATYPSLTDLGRVRMDFDARASHELVKDFTIALTFFDSFDSRPPSTTASKNDFGGTLSLGWKF